MAQSWNRFWRLRLVSAFTGGLVELCVGIACPLTDALAQLNLTPDRASKRNLGTTVIPLTPKTDLITGGIRPENGSNLFHSFSEFNIREGRGVYFDSPTGVTNILSRVTGNDPSNILGTLGVTGGNANLFLINPKGIIFGPNASLDVKGSFVATTANAIQFGSQGFFSASAADVPPLLTVNPSAFLFNQIAAQDIQPITVQSRRYIGDPSAPPSDPFIDNTFNFYEGLEVPNRKSLILLGGNVRLDGGVLLAPGSRVELGGVAGTDTVGLSVDGSDLRLSFPSGARRADVSLSSGAVVDVTAGNAGSIAVNVRNLEILGESFLRAGIQENLGSVSSQAGNITLNATGVIRIEQSSNIRNNVSLNATGDGGDITIQADSLYFNDNSGLILGTLGQGNAGSTLIETSGPVSIEDNSGISTFVGFGAVGRGGDITIRASSLSVSNGSSFFTSTFGQGNAGSTLIETSGPVSFDDTNSLGFDTGIISNSEAIGKGGDITIRASSLSLINGAIFTSSTAGQGDAGNMMIEVNGPVSLISDSFGSSNTIESRVESAGVGKGGDIIIRADSLFLSNGARLRASSEGSGTAGNLEVTASSIRLDNKAALSSDTIAGQGNLILRSESLVLRRTSKITTNATGTATGGNITIDTGVLAAFEDSDITANAEEAAGGRVEIDAQGVFGTEFRDQPTLESDITASSNLGPRFSGSVEINTPDIDPSEGVVALPDVPVNVEVAQSCQAGNQQASVEFFNTGRGGIAPNPYEPLSSSGIWEDVPRGAETSTDRTPAPTSPTTLPNKSVEAQGWLINDKGETILVAEAPITHPSRCRLR